MPAFVFPSCVFRAFILALIVLSSSLGVCICLGDLGFGKVGCLMESMILIRELVKGSRPVTSSPGLLVIFSTFGGNGYEDLSIGCISTTMISPGLASSLGTSIIIVMISMSCPYHLTMGL
jgi:hypothetical protein